MALTKAKAPPVNLSEYAEERLPFDAVIKTLGKAKPTRPVTPAPKPKKKARTRA